MLIDITLSMSLKLIELSYHVTYLAHGKDGEFTKECYFRTIVKNFNIRLISICFSIIIPMDISLSSSLF